MATTTITASTTGMIAVTLMAAFPVVTASQPNASPIGITITVGWHLTAPASPSR